MLQVKMYSLVWNASVEIAPMAGEYQFETNAKAVARFEIRVWTYAG
jgi:hypothetical protein